MSDHSLMPELVTVQSNGSTIRVHRYHFLMSNVTMFSCFEKDHGLHSCNPGLFLTYFDSSIKIVFQLLSKYLHV